MAPGFFLIALMLDVTAMITDVKTFGEFVAAGGVRSLISTLEAPDITSVGVDIADGHLIIDEGMHLPVVNGVTSSKVFGVARYQPWCERGLGSVVSEISDAVFVHGTRNYYHFMTFDLPQLLLLQARKTPRTVLAMGEPFLPSIADMMTRVVAALTPGRSVELHMVPEGTHKLKNVVMGARPTTSLAPFMCRRLLIPLALERAGLKDPIKEIGPIKLFVKRENARSGRALTNQPDLEDWCVRRGYTTVNPGNMALDEQIILFSRATHIVGVEGAAMTNLLFATNAQDVTVVSSPVTAEEKFFSAVAKYYPCKFQTVVGQIDTVGETVSRTSDYRIDMKVFEAAMER